MNTIDVIGDENVFKAIVNGGITEFIDDIITTIGSNAFANCSSLTTVSFPSATRI